MVENCFSILLFFFLRGLLGKYSLIEKITFNAMDRANFTYLLVKTLLVCRLQHVLCSYHISTSSMCYQSTYTLLNGIYVLISSKSFLCSIQYDSLKKIHKARVPTLFLSGLADQLIPPRMMTSLYKVCLFIRYR